VKVVVLGTAAGGGFPQWNCACPLCTNPTLPARTQDCLAVSATGTTWYLINASPDLRPQILAAKPLAPGPGPRDTPIRGALLTDAELDHTLGLTLLREAGSFHVHAPAAVLTALRTDFPLQPLVARYGAWEWHPVPDEFTLDGLRVKVFPVGSKRPKYASSEVDGPWVVAYRITDPATGGTLVYAPCLATWPAGFDTMVAEASCVILDGTFYSPDEMAGAANVGAPRQRAMGHIPIGGPDGSLVRIADHPGKRWIYTHLNNTNPILDRESREYATVVAAGGEVVDDGAELVI
jgi:pyrroloquinoline quinone biosynthesis protein B